MYFVFILYKVNIASRISVTSVWRLVYYEPINNFRGDNYHDVNEKKPVVMAPICVAKVPSMRGTYITRWLVTKYGCLSKAVLDKTKGVLSYIV